jgi:hypothetical protein
MRKIIKSSLLLLLVLTTGCQHIFPLVSSESQSTVPTVVEKKVDSNDLNILPSVTSSELNCQCVNQDVAKIEQSCKSLPAQLPIKKIVAKKVDIEDLIIIGRIEYVYIQPDNVKLKSRIDTGAGLTSMHAIDIVNFERDGKPWVKFLLPVSNKKTLPIERPVSRFVAIKQLSGKSQRRPVVAMGIKLGQIIEKVEITLTNRNEYVYPMLIGRNFLRDRAIVDVGKKFSIK